MKHFYAFLFWFVVIFPSFRAFSQTIVRCATMENDSLLRAKHPKLGTLDEFEAWLQERIRETRLNRDGGQIFTIPVVVHVIHNGETVGTGTNISDAQILSQIEVLNQDYRKMYGTRGYNVHADGSDTRIEFCMARRRPDGTATTGINRINRNVMGWTAPPYTQAYMDGTIKPATIWDPNRYLNMWVANLGGGLLGYAQFPERSSLRGMAAATSCPATPAASTDGLVMLYSAFGTTDPNPAFTLGFPYDKGRTTTHEIGHWVGLRHIWGDGNCSVDDFCHDTPTAGAANYGCPTINSCTDPAPDRPDMVQNYMDYTDDACMNIFTHDQTVRMRTVMLNSPRRRSLVTSNACVPPTTNDAAVIAVTHPVGDYCNATITPVVTIRNNGGNNLASVTVRWQADGGPINSFAWTGTLTPSATLTLTLSPMTVSLGEHSFKAWTTLPNGLPDPEPQRDTAYSTFAYSLGIAPPFFEDFESNVFPPKFWRRVNVSDDCYTWAEVPNIVGIAGTRTTAAFVYHYNYNGTSQTDELISPVIDLTGVSAATLNFDLAHRRYDASTNERLRILVSTDCGATWPSVVYNKCDACAAPNNLPTLAAGTADFFPTANTQWRTESVNLAAFIGQRVRLKFETTNSYGNNTFIDNIRIPATGPKISFVNTATTTAESSADGTSGCRGYVDVTIPLQISAAPTGAATVTFSSAGSAHNGADFQILTPTVVFPNAATGNQNLIVRVFDDAAVENNETVVVSFSVSGATNASASSTNIVHTITIGDNDAEPSPATVFLLNQNFNTLPNFFPDGWSYRNVVSTNNQWIVGPNGGSGITGHSAYVTNNPSTRPLAYTNSQNTDIFLYSPLIDARKYSNLMLSFKYKCNGEAGNDRGFVYYSYDLVNFVQILGPYNGTSAATTVNFSLPAALNGKEFYLAWRFVSNNNSVGSNPPFLVDDVTVTAPATPIENTLSSVQRYLGPRSTVYFVNAAGRLMAKIVNDTDHDYGCTTVEIDRTGTSAVAFQNPAASGHITSKTILVTPTNNKPDGEYTATLYYLSGEATGWESATSNLWNDATIVKSGGAIKNVTPATPDANGPTNYYGTSPATGTYGTGQTVTATFNTGFSGMGVGKPGPGGPIMDPPLFLDGFMLSGRMENETAVLTWPETCVDCKYVLEKCVVGKFFSPEILPSQNGFYREPLLGTAYYRVKRRNWDQTDYSNVVELSSERFALYPNPVVESVRVVGAKTVVVYDVLGREIYRMENAEEAHEIRTEHWPDGAYTAVCATGGRVERKTFVKKSE